MRSDLRILLAVSIATGWPGGANPRVIGQDFSFPKPGPISDADPTVREEREILVPDGFQTARTADLLAVRLDAGPLKPIKFTVGHKMALGTNIKLYIYPEGTERPSTPRSEQWASGTPDKVHSRPGFYPTEPFGFVQRAKPYVIEEEITVFETDLPPQHLWMPQGHQFKVLWQTTLRQVPKEEGELPDDLRKSKAAMDRIKGQPFVLPVPQDFLPTDSEDAKRLLATPITAEFQFAPIPAVIGYLAQESHANMVAKLTPAEGGQPLEFFGGFDHVPLRTVLYHIAQGHHLKIEWEFEQGAPAQIVVTDGKP